jgi:polar amino acid transport system permease protein
VSQPVPPEQIKAIPVRHPWRWVAIGIIAVVVAQFLHLLLTNPAFKWSFLWQHMFDPPVLRGLKGTVIATVLAMFFGILLGIVVAIARLSENPVLRIVSWFYTWFFRAIPRLVLLTLLGSLGVLWSRLEFGFPFDDQLGNLFGVQDMRWRLFGFSVNDLLRGLAVGVLGLALSEAAYMAEIVRAGMLSVDPGQQEAATALGMSRSKTLRRIVLPQAMRVIIPPTGNETIAMLKDTSLLIAIPVTEELFFQLDAVGKRTFQIFPMYVAACMWYLILVSVLLVGQHYLEKYYARGTSTADRAKVKLEGLAGEQGGKLT